jgi:hypothetical protein
MKVGLEGSLRKALLKGCLWMNESGGSLEGVQDEASLRSKLLEQRLPTAKAYAEASSKICFL